VFLNFYFFFRNDTVEVGGPLYEIDTDGVAAETNTKSPSSHPVSDLPTPPAQLKATSLSATESIVGPRNPSIHFLGKEGWHARKSKPQTEPSHEPVKTIDAHALQSNRGAIARETESLPPMYGRNPFTEAEMEALITGGASIAPVFKKISST
jgi:hypothetical protein